MYYNTGDFVEKKATGKIFRILTVHLESTGGYKYVLVPVEYQMADIKEVNSAHISDYEKV